MTTQLLFAGFGGQGLLFMGKVLAYAGLLGGLQVSWLPSYGPEMKGGTANCSVILSDAPIGSPVVLAPGVLVAMNLPSFTRFAPKIKAGGLLIADSSLISVTSEREDLRAFYIPATQMAFDEGLDGLANMILLGKLLKETGLLLQQETIRLSMEKCVPPRKAALLESNLTAIALGQGL